LKEALVLGEVLSYLKTRKDVLAWRNNTGGASYRGRFVKYGCQGSADVLACWRGKMVAIECKGTSGSQSPDQKRWQAKLEAAGGVYLLVRDAAEVEAWLDAQEAQEEAP